MKQNFFKLGEKEINKLTCRKNILLHCCCGPCSTSVIEYLYNFFNITVLFYNPNISPYEEYKKRKDELLIYIKKIPNIKYIDSDYDNNIYNSMVYGLEKEKEGGKRCLICYKLRLKKTAEIAKRNNYDYFCTTLSVSPYKNSETINEIGKELEDEFKVNWLFSDFKKNNGYKRSIELSKENNLYRQNYCGCIYSKR